MSDPNKDMATRSRRRKIEINRSKLVAYFDKAPRRVYSETLLQASLTRDLRQLVGTALSSKQFLTFLVEQTELRKIEISQSIHPLKPIERYVWGEASAYEVALSIAKGYLSHGSAVSLHGLTDNLPRVVYINREQSPKGGIERSELSQGGIDRAFSRKQRSTNFICRWEDWQFAVLSGKHTGGLEVGSMTVDGLRFPVTNLERTLIDITVRPAYGGGVFQVIEAFKNARERLSIGTLLATLKQLNYAYPYHQAIGFYLEHAGYAPEQFERFLPLGLDFDFYLAHDLRDTEFVKKWRLYVPKGL